MNFKKAFKKFYFQKILGFRPMTVVLRHKISPEQEKYLQSHKNFLTLQNFRNLEKNLGREIFLEIGFGGGEHVVSLAQENKENKNLKIVGVELYKPGVVKVLKQIDFLNLKNLFVSCDDARDVLQKISKENLGKIFILFPDPWTKKRQFERRLVNEKFLEKCLEKLKKNGEIIFATDWANYAQEIENILKILEIKNKVTFEKVNNNENEKENNFEEFTNILNTNFAKRAKREGRAINIFVIKKQK